jgi:hypothetical protein
MVLFVWIAANAAEVLRRRRHVLARRRACERRLPCAPPSLDSTVGNSPLQCGCAHIRQAGTRTWLARVRHLASQITPPKTQHIQPARRDYGAFGLDPGLVVGVWSVIGTSPSQSFAYDATPNENSIFRSLVGTRRASVPLEGNLSCRPHFLAEPRRSSTRLTRPNEGKSYAHVFLSARNPWPASFPHESFDSHIFICNCQASKRPTEEIKQP